jgi:hypothetical protein
MLRKLRDARITRFKYAQNEQEIQFPRELRDSNTFKEQSDQNFFLGQIFRSDFENALRVRSLETRRMKQEGVLFFILLSCFAPSRIVAPTFFFAFFLRIVYDIRSVACCALFGTFDLRSVSS